MASFTPGPWVWEYHPDRNGYAALTAGKTDVIHVTGDHGQSWIEMDGCDAQLIAAAPDLLAALKLADALIANAEGGDGFHISDDERKQITDAIRKAEGSAS